MNFLEQIPEIRFCDYTPIDWFSIGFDEFYVHVPMPDLSFPILYDPIVPLFRKERSGYEPFDYNVPNYNIINYGAKLI
jgi:hypothetical protein